MPVGRNPEQEPPAQDRGSSRRAAGRSAIATSIGFPLLHKNEATYFSHVCVQPFLLGHKLQFLIENSFFLGLEVEPGVRSTKISAG